MKVICQIYRSSRDSGMYLYCRKDQGTSKVPEELMQRFGRAEPAMVLVLDENRKLANADIGKVLQSLDEKGYYLQLPPLQQMDAEAAAVRSHNSKLDSGR
ncbi:YcgL domain-containing protein [Gilvimarinus sp. DA14]|uniref:YcgL domain-containing protein n=1 Tax=Gilvimarinus sp. DA14 TaxID=2956798 RepID=UPI0020B86B99|nr:YcgL domain-containing protein [Gilvimarinus sp. DA14]UTF61180.1 YcgL domain-containing protein [Gilvimarinus sp. DA14]